MYLKYQISHTPVGAPSKLKPPDGTVSGAPNMLPVAWSVINHEELSPDNTLISTNSTQIESSVPSPTQIVVVVSVVFSI